MYIYIKYIIIYNILIPSLFLIFPLRNYQDLNQEDRPEPAHPSGIDDNRQCVLCLKYGDEKATVSQHSRQTNINELSGNFKERKAYKE